MRLLFLAGLVYLTGVAVVLYIRPQLMFTEDGVWKEFGIGKSPQTHTWFPVWLFCLVWALLSYFLVVLLTPDESWLTRIQVESPAPEKFPSSHRRSPNMRRVRYVEKVKPGYYMLNTEGSGIEGVPRYVYLGTDLPADVGTGQA